MNPYLNLEFLKQTASTRKQLVEVKYHGEKTANRFSLYLGLGLNFNNNNLLGSPSSHALVKVAVSGFELEVRVTDVRHPKNNLAFLELGILQEAIAVIQAKFAEDYGLDMSLVDELIGLLDYDFNKTLIHQTCRPIFKDNRLETARDIHKELVRVTRQRFTETDVIKVAEWFNAGRLEFTNPTTRRV